LRTRTSWIIDPFHDSSTGEPIKLEVIIGAMIVAVLGAILVFMDHQITAVVVNKTDFKTEKGSAYHLDLFVCALLLSVSSAFGFPWMVAATLRSIAHVQSLTKYQSSDNGPVIEKVIENRVTPFVVHFLIGASMIVCRPLLAMLPNAILYGLFLYMGVSSLAEGNQFFTRLKALLIFESANQLPLSYIRHLPHTRLLLYTFFQIVCLLGLVLVKMSFAALLFPVVLLGLVGIRWVIEKTGIFTKEELQLLDSKEDVTDKILNGDHLSTSSYDSYTYTAPTITHFHSPTSHIGYGLNEKQRILI